MPVFSYTAFAENGTLIKGERSSLSLPELTQELAAKGLLLQQAQPKRTAVIGRRRRIKSESLLLFNQEMIALVRAGLTIPEALRLAAERPSNPTVGKILQRILDDVRHGTALSEACRRHPEMFDGLYVAALQTGERTGNVVEVLTRYQAFLRQRAELQKKLMQALIYPIFLLSTLAVILLALFIFVLPRFTAMYADFGATLPLPTRLLMGLVDGLPIYVPLAALLMGGVWAAWRAITATEAGRIAIDNFLERVPVWGGLARNIAVAQTARTLETLLAGGTPLVEALRACEQSFTQRLSAQRLRRVLVNVTEGGSLAASFKMTQMMPDIALKMIEVGEATGELGAMLGEVARFYEERISTLLTRLMSLLEPSLMLLIGVVIGGIIIVMYLPIFYIAEVVQ